jgi:ring-1,2-phenylacetyl-CoA epoxidase subunit PaaC
MSAGTAAGRAGVDSSAAFPPEARAALRDLLLALADNKRLLGIRYSDWMLGSPSLETGIAASSMAQDEWGHARLTYALLADFGEDPRRLEHDRGAEAYHTMEALDAPFASWVEMIAASVVIDTALTAQYGALVRSRYTPVHNRVQKLLDEELLHFQYAAGWIQHLAGGQLRDDFQAALARLLPVALRWLGRPDAAGLRVLEEEGIVREGPEALRARFLKRIGPALARAGLAAELGLTEADDAWSAAANPAWEGWDDARRRAACGGPDPETLSRVRGDLNRAMLLD